MADKFPSDKQDKFMLRLPDGMRDEIAKQAKANGRSMNAEIVQRLEESLAAWAGPGLDDVEPVNLTSEEQVVLSLAAAQSMLRQGMRALEVAKQGVLDITGAKLISADSHGRYE